MTDPRWNWEDMDLRAQLHIGTVLESDDFAYIRVLETTRDGVITRGLTKRREFWSWETLEKGQFRIHSQPGDDPAQAEPRGPVIRDRGGVVDISAATWP